MLFFQYFKNPIILLRISQFRVSGTTIVVAIIFFPFILCALWPGAVTLIAITCCAFWPGTNAFISRATGAFWPSTSAFVPRTCCAFWPGTNTLIPNTTGTVRPGTCARRFFTCFTLVRTTGAFINCAGRCSLRHSCRK
mgnify:CR=1 FL=1